jgi:diguanylate cyclase (GGDEF)-like protein
MQAHGNRHKLRALYLALCALQLLITGLGLTLAHNVEQSYSQNIAYERMVNAEGRAVTELAALALASTPQDLSLDDSAGPQNWSEKKYACTLFIAKAQDLLQDSQKENSPLARSEAELRSLIADMSEVARQQLLAAAASAQGDAPRLRAYLTYAERAAARLNTTLGNIREEISRAKDEVLAAQTSQVYRVRSYLRPLSILGLLFVLPAILYARSLDKHIWAYEAKLEEERNQLEDRVTTRTAALRAEIERRIWVESFNRSRNRLLEMVVEGKCLEDVLSQLAEAAEKSMPEGRCLISLLGGESGLIIAPRIAPEVVSRVTPVLTSQWQLLTPAQADGSLFLTDADPDTKAAHPALWTNGVHALLAVPITERPEEELGFVALLLTDNRKPDGFLKEMLLSAGRMAAVAMAHYRMQDELFRRAHHDPLTDLPNRILFEDRLQQAMARARRSERKVGVLCIDLDGFKQINDQHGHQTGDWLLRQVAARLTSRLRSTDTVARFGGDEFLAVLDDLADTDGIATVSESVLRALEEPFVIGATVLRTTASIGAAVFPSDGNSADELKRNADLALYRAKERGRNTYQIFSAALSEKLARRREIECRLREALEHNGFELYYQPIYTVARELVGLEALLRFRPSELKAISPGEFIPVAEQTGLISQVGEWVMREVCRQGKEWQAEGFAPVPIAINVSAIQLGRLDFAAQVAQILRETGFPPERLRIEVTETAMMNDVEEGGKQLYALEELGVHISIDDFGTGHSSLSYIHHLPIDTLKIDRSFVQQLVSSDETRAVVRAITAMARALELTVVAEGVETQAQLSAAATAGCDVIQGYLFGRPQDAGSLRGLLACAGQVAQRESRRGTAPLSPATGLQQAGANSRAAELLNGNPESLQALTPCP